MARSLVVKLTVGADAPERCVQGLTVAATAAAAGVAVSLWLTGDGSWLAATEQPQVFEVPHSAPVADLVAAVLGAGTVTVCTQCAVRRRLTQADLLEGVRIAGAAAFVEEALAEGAQALVY